MTIGIILLKQNICVLKGRMKIAQQFIAGINIVN
ncbi:MAG: hypothetical protein QOH63_3067 [Acidobacteriota bacterium]|jgi:hypothetical protein|nr:hypothetical protein [Acidobacteriota bacterium]